MKLHKKSKNNVHVLQIGVSFFFCLLYIDFYFSDLPKYAGKQSGL